jgi:PPOX class probable F420-dependent enzyme
MAELPDDVRGLLEAPNFAHLATVLPDGSPHSVPIWVRLEADRIAFFTQPGSRKAQNLAGDPRVALSLTDIENPYLSVGSAAGSRKPSRAGGRWR